MNERAKPLDPDALCLATFLVRELDKATRDVARTASFPHMHATAEGRAEAILVALAYMGGYYGWSRTEAFILHVRDLAPRPTLVAPARFAPIEGGPSAAAIERHGFCLNCRQRIGSRHLPVCLFGGTVGATRARMAHEMAIWPMVPKLDRS